ncbi:MAG: type I restriction enzyme HsdR N-terminal domain-containing protein [Planctomycetales bacterium]|nr:type I restriction enzyme HsdR N-terminal domain-containing protein [Planctomycetales bacterium]
MQRKQPTKDDMIAELQRIQARDGQVSQAVFKEETGWGRHWFDRHWPIGGYQSACEEAGVKRGAIFGVETNLRVTEEELAIKLAEVVQQLGGKIPSSKRFKAIALMDPNTLMRGDSWSDAKRRVISVYFRLPADKRIGELVDAALQKELSKLNGVDAAPDTPTTSTIARHSVQVPPAYVALVQQFRTRGEEEKRQLVAQFFYEVLGYKRARVRSEHKHNDVQVYDRREQPWLVVEVKPLLETERDRRAARRQGFDYAHRHGMRFVVISDGDFYEIFDRCAGQRLRYDEMRQGSFHLSALRSRDSDLLSLLAAER